MSGAKLYSRRLTAPSGLRVEPAQGRQARRLPQLERSEVGLFSSGEARLSGFRRQRRHKKWRPIGRPPSQRSGTIYLPRAEPSTRPGGVSRFRTEPLALRAAGPIAPSTLTPVRACQPSGIQVSTVGPQQCHIFCQGNFIDRYH